MGDTSLAGEPAKEVSMPWKASSVMDERARFIARLLEGESMSTLCREAGISRKAGYKILKRYKAVGVTAIAGRSRRPWRYANQVPPQLETMIVGLKKGKPRRGLHRLFNAMDAGSDWRGNVQPRIYRKPAPSR